MSILGCDRCATQVDSDYDTESLVEILGAVKCLDCAELEGNGELHPLSDQHPDNQDPDWADQHWAIP